MPSQVSAVNPLNRAHRTVQPYLLACVFEGKAPTLKAAYEALQQTWNRSTLDQVVIYYLKLVTPKRIRFFSPTFSIPGHSLSNDDLNFVVAVCLYQHYGELRDAERERFESKMARDQEVKMGCALS